MGASAATAPQAGQRREAKNTSYMGPENGCHGDGTPSMVTSKSVVRGPSPTSRSPHGNATVGLAARETSPTGRKTHEDMKTNRPIPERGKLGRWDARSKTTALHVAILLFASACGQATRYAGQRRRGRR